MQCSNIFNSRVQSSRTVYVLSLNNDNIVLLKLSNCPFNELLVVALNCESSLSKMMGCVLDSQVCFPVGVLECFSLP
jgi:hypothetical protein